MPDMLGYCLFCYFWNFATCKEKQREEIELEREGPRDE
jgi:hypothetical protein